MVGASNEYPSESGELQALYDRFLFRIWLDASLSRTAFHQLLNAGPETDNGKDITFIPDTFLH